HLFVDQAAPDIDQVPVLHPRRTGGFAVAACQAAVQMLLSRMGGLRAFKHLLDEIDAAARPIQLVAEHLVRRARGRTEPAMHAAAQDSVGLAAVVGVTRPGSKISLHTGSELPYQAAWIEQAGRIQFMVQAP